MPRTRSHKHEQPPSLLAESEEQARTRSEEAVVGLLELRIQQLEREAEHERTLREHWFSQWHALAVAPPLVVAPLAPPSVEAELTQQKTPPPAAVADTKQESPPQPIAPPAVVLAAAAPPPPKRFEAFHPGLPNRFGHYDCCAAVVRLCTNNGCQMRLVTQ